MNPLTGYPPVIRRDPLPPSQQTPWVWIGIFFAILWLLHLSH